MIQSTKVPERELRHKGVAGAGGRNGDHRSPNPDFNGSLVVEVDTQPTSFFAALSSPSQIPVEYLPMLTRLFPFLDPVRIKPDFATRLRALAEDCEQHELGLTVSQLWLEKAPLLEDWAPTMTPQGLRLVGHASGHPVFGDRAVLTSPLCFADPEDRWVRTLSRFYRLGSSVDPKDIRRVLRASGAIREGNWEEEA